MERNGKAGTVRANRDGVNRVKARGNGAEVDFARTRRFRESSLIPLRARGDPFFQKIYLCRLELLLRRHVRIGLGRQHTYQFALIRLFRREDWPFIGPFERRFTRGEIEAAFVLFGVVATKAVALQKAHGLGGSARSSESCSPTESKQEDAPKGRLRFLRLGKHVA